MNNLQLSPLQKAYVVGRQRDLDLHVHPHLYLEFTLDSCDRQRLQQAVDSLLIRHSMLRTIVSSEAIVPLAEEVGCQIIEHDLSDLNHLEQETQLNIIRDRLYRADLTGESLPNITVEISQIGKTARVHFNFDLLFLDAKSVKIILRELSQTYSNPGLCPSLTCDLRNYTTYLNRQNSPGHQSAQQSWFQQLKNLPEAAQLPLRKTAVPRRSHLVRHRQILAPEQWQSICDRATQQEIDPTTLLLSAFSLVIAYWSKRQHFSLTMMIQNRARFPELADALGNFTSTVLLEIDWREAKSFARQAREIQHQIFQNVTYALIHGLDALEALPRLNRQTGAAFHVPNPVVFTSILDRPSTENTGDIFQLEGENQVFSGLETPQILLDHQAVLRPDGGLALIWDAMNSAFTGEIVQDMFDAYVALIGDLATETAWENTYFDQRSEQAPSFYGGVISDWRSPQERNCQLEYNRVPAPSSEWCLHEYLYRQARQTPDKTLIIDSRRRFTYQEVVNLANKIAWTLHNEYQVKPNQLIGICAAKGWEQVVAAQAIMSAGAAYVPLAPDLPEKRQLDILERCDCRLVLVDSLGDRHCSWTGVTKVLVDAPDREIENYEPLPTSQTPEDLAYVIFTSGSTGKPKGVSIAHRGVVNTIEDVNRRFQVDADDVLFGISRFTFDLSVYDIFGAIAAGATLVLPPPEAIGNPALCVQLIQKYGVTVWNSVPALAQLIQEYLSNKVSDCNLVKSLPIRLFLLSGDWIPLQLSHKLKNLFAAQVISLGGATECSIWSIYYEVGEIDSSWQSIPYGNPLGGQTVYILDSRMQPRPNDVPGEIYIGGVGVAQGYLKDSTKTAKAFLIHPKLGERLYRTGDWGVFRTPGYIEFLGREDQQIKLRGYRIELGEIEATLQRYPGVANAVVKTIGQESSAYLVAYIILNDKKIDWQTLQQYLSTLLPRYMVPTQGLFLEKFPLSSHGKVDRAKLPLPFYNNCCETDEPLQTVTEQKLAHLWSDILEVDVSNRNSNFFELGGNSFTAVHLITSINETFGTDVAVTILLQKATLKGLADSIERLIGDRQSTESAKSWFYVSSITGKTAATEAFWFHPSGGGVFCYQDLVKLLPARFHLFGINSDWQWQDNFPSVSEMADAYVAKILAIQPSGSYCLGGWSMGGVIAYKVARQLTNMGKAIKHLTLIDSPSPVIKPVPSLKELLLWFINDLVERELTDFCFSATEDDRFLVSKVLTEAQDMGLIPRGKTENLSSLFEIFRGNICALYQYQAEPIEADFDCLAIFGKQNFSRRVGFNTDKRWRGLLPDQTSFVMLDGNHYSLLKPPLIEKLANLMLNRSFIFSQISSLKTRSIYYRFS